MGSKTVRLSPGNLVIESMTVTPVLGSKISTTVRNMIAIAAQAECDVRCDYNGTEISISYADVSMTYQGVKVSYKEVLEKAVAAYYEGTGVDYEDIKDRV